MSTHTFAWITAHFNDFNVPGGMNG